ncbi:MAG TPA: peptidoglycan-binding domain-containing protein, partial [Chthoniobacterales bacterium]
MKALFIASALAGVMFASTMRADQLTASAQQTLKDQGFYYGEVTGNKDSDTSAAIRRYQIRNGLQVNGELNAETLKSLGIKGSAAPRSTPTATPRTAP